MIKTKIKRLLSTFLVAVMVLSISSVQIFAEESPTGEAPIKQAVSIMALASTAITIDRTRTLDSIVAMAKALPHSGFDSSIVTRYAVDPIFTSPHSAGTLNADDVADALNAFKMVRYVAGLSYENLNFKAELNNYSQHAAVYLAVTNQLTHGPTDLGGFSQNFFDLAYIGCNQANLYSGISNISASILGFVRDPGASNIAVAGHRRWLLKPGGKNYGIGYAKYATNLPRISMHTLDTEGAGDADTYIAWPSSGDFPIQYFTASNNINATAEPPWSINLGDAYSVPTRESINLVLTRASDGKTWTFNSSTPTLGDGNYPANDSQHLSVDNDGYGMRKAIIFRPDLTSLGAIKDGEIFTVNLSGIKTSAGEATTLTYNVNFFDLEKEMARSRVNITVKNGSTPISGATVEIDGKTLTTDASGLATLRVNNGASYPYTVSKTGYHTETGTVAVTSDAVSVDVSLLVPVSFVISDISKTYNGTAQGVTVSATPNAAYTVKYNGSAQVPTDAGTYSVTVEADSPNVGSATATLTISKANIAVKADDNAKKVGESDPGLTHTVTSGSLFSPDSFTGALARVAGEAVNTYAINQGTLALSANYNLTFTPGVFTITDKTPQNITVTGITVDGTTSKTYGDAPFGVTATPDSASGLNSFTYVSSDTNVAEISNTGQITIKSAGTTTITVSQAGNADYAAFTASTTLSVAKVAIAVTAENKTKKIGSSDPVLTYTFTGTLVSGDIFTGALARVAGDAVDTYAINQGTLALSSNYSLTFTPGVFTITEKTPQNITVTGIAVGGTTSKTYGDAPFVVTATPDTASGLTDFTFASSDTNVAEISDSGQITIKSAGTTTITVSQAGNADYAAFTASTTLSVAKVAIAVTAENKTKKIGSDDPDLTYTFTGTLVSGDIFTGALARVAGDAVGTYPINQGTLALSANYNLTFTPGVFTITDKTPQNVTVTGITVGGTTSKTYGDVPFVVTATPDSASGLTDFTFTSSDTSVAEISGAGQITIKNAGTTTITVSQA
ncbi:MAG: MBG domain-containing protein, partial [Clostridiales bacterium]|nr:MBG domain-containing protein [Clostridiales bacterium]